ncbi:hypothetical protein CYLTODRAFT_327075, partial [Cylindrobasidium torrendii FP15055 ss-10]
ILNRARSHAEAKKQYNSSQMRRELQRLFTEKFSRPAYDWHLDVTESVLLGLDTVLLAGTGFVKTMPL